MNVKTNIKEIPNQLKSIDNWIGWKSEKRDGKPTKVPYNPATGKMASSTNPTTWTDFDTVKKSSKYGLGFVFTGSTYAGVDLDGCRNPDTGEIAQKARKIVEWLDSYTEISPSGTGLHIIVKGKFTGDGNKTGDVEGFKELEMYHTGRYFTVTGNHLKGTPETIKERTEKLQKLHDRYFKSQSKDAKELAGEGIGLSDSQVLKLARNAKNGDKFEKLWRGDTSDYPSHSEADLALCSHLAFYTGPDISQIDRLFRKSELVRDKWINRPDYRERTIKKTLEETTEFYSPSTNKEKPKKSKPAKKKRPAGRKATYYQMAVDIDPEQLKDAPTFPKKVVKELPVIGEYVAWIDTNTETPASFAFAAFKNQLGLLLGRRVRTAYGQMNHYPIFYDGLVGKSAFSRKSSTIRVANNIIQKATSIPGEEKDFLIIPGVGSAEGVLKKLEGSTEAIQGQYAKALLMLEEMSILTDKMGQSRTQAFISRLNELWGVPSDRVINPTISNPIDIEKPTVSLLAGSTVENLKGAWEERTIEGGFFNRFCWWLSSELKIKPEVEKMPTKVENELVDKVQGVVKFSKQLKDHEFVKTEEAQKRFNEWYRNWRKKLFKKDQEDVVIARIPDLVVRHALLFSVLLGQHQITLEAIEKAITIGSYLQKTAYHVLERFTETSMDKLKKRVITVLNDRGKVKKSELSQATSSYFEGGVRELNMLLKDLEELEIIEST